MCDQHTVHIIMNTVALCKSLLQYVEGKHKLTNIVNNSGTSLIMLIGAKENVLISEVSLISGVVIICV